VLGEEIGAKTSNVVYTFGIIYFLNNNYNFKN